MTNINQVLDGHVTRGQLAGQRSGRKVLDRTVGEPAVDDVDYDGVSRNRGRVTTGSPLFGFVNVVSVTSLSSPKNPP